jgi:hypothetical protein
VEAQAAKREWLEKARETKKEEGRVVLMARVSNGERWRENPKGRFRAMFRA